MSNVHGISDFPDNSNRNNMRNSNNNQGVPLMGNRFNNDGNPREQSFFGFLKGFCCPNFTPKSFVFIITIIDIILYIITLCVKIQPASLNKVQILAPTIETLRKYGALVK
jgi:hypothetical protein